MPAVETVAVVINAQSGIEVVTRRMMEIARSRDLPRAIIINKIDLPEIDLEALWGRFRRRLATNACRSICPPAEARRSWNVC